MVTVRAAVSGATLFFLNSSVGKEDRGIGLHFLDGSYWLPPRDRDVTLTTDHSYPVRTLACCLSAQRRRASRRGMVQGFERGRDPAEVLRKIMKHLCPDGRCHARNSNPALSQ
jgi:hypothetical protein